MYKERQENTKVSSAQFVHWAGCVCEEPTPIKHVGCALAKSTFTCPFTPPTPGAYSSCCIPDHLKVEEKDTEDRCDSHAGKQCPPVVVIASNPNTHNPTFDHVTHCFMEVAADGATETLDVQQVTDDFPKPLSEHIATGLETYIARGCLQRDCVPCLVQPFLRGLLQGCSLLRLIRYVFLDSCCASHEKRASCVPFVLNHTAAQRAVSATRHGGSRKAL